MRTLHLVERRSREVKLPREDEVFLRKYHSHIVDIVPTQGRARLVTARGYVGVLQTPHLRIVLHPKIPLVNVCRLLDPSSPVEITEDSTQAQRGTEWIDFLAGLLADRLTERATAGLHRSYVEQTDQRPFLQGRLDVANQLREPVTRRDRFHCRFEEFTVDSPWNRIPKTTAEWLLSAGLLSPSARRRLQDSLRGWEDVTSDPTGLLEIDRLLPDPRMVGYRTLIDLCRLLARLMSPGPREGDAPTPAFLLSMELLFERYLARQLRSALPSSFRVLEQESFPLHQMVPGTSVRQVRPDVVVTREGQAVCLLDTKWKDYSGDSEPGDVHQVIAYGTALNVRDVRLIYPGKRYSIRRLPLLHSPMVLTIQTLRVVGDGRRCDDSIRRLVRSIRKEPSF